MALLLLIERDLNNFNRAGELHSGTVLNPDTDPRDGESYDGPDYFS